jgi:hypothetical protein
MILLKFQAFHVDASSETILASIANLRDQPGSPERDFSASLIGIYADFKRFNYFSTKTIAKFTEI